MTNAKFSDATHLFYNPVTNCMVTIQYRSDLGLFEVLRSDADYIQLMSMNTIIEKRKGETWEFLDVL